MPEGDQYGLPADLKDNWDDIRRSLPRRGRSPRTIKTYRDNYVEFWRWALALEAPSRPRFQARCDQAKIPLVNPHRFRHTRAHEFRAPGGRRRPDGPCRPEL